MRLPLIMILALIAFALVDDFGIWMLGRGFVKNSKKLWNRVWWSFAFLCYVILIVGISLPRRSADVGILPNMWLLFVFLTIYSAKTIALICGLIGLIPKIFGGKRYNSLLWTGVPAAILTLGVMWWGALVTRSSIDIEEITVSSADLPEAFDGFRIVQLSDMHVGTWGSDTIFVSQVVDTVLSLNPDLIVFTGDIVNRETLEIMPFINTLSRLKSPNGVYSVLGNHDYGDYITWNNEAEHLANNRLLAEIEKQIGWNLLNNRHEFVFKDNDSIAVIGVENWGEPPFRQYGILENAYSKDSLSSNYIGRDVFKILLSHNPEHWRRVISKTTDIDLTLSGHTHAMQTEIRFGDLKWSPAVFKYEEWGGLYEKESPSGKTSQIYVNIGLGEVGLPFRIGATPEITVITLRRTSPQDIK